MPGQWPERTWPEHKLALVGASVPTALDQGHSKVASAIWVCQGLAYGCLAGSGRYPGRVDVGSLTCETGSASAPSRCGWKTRWKARTTRFRRFAGDASAGSGLACGGVLGAAAGDAMVAGADAAEDSAGFVTRTGGRGPGSGGNEPVMRRPRSGGFSAFRALPAVEWDSGTSGAAATSLGEGEGCVAASPMFCGGAGDTAAALSFAGRLRTAVEGTSEWCVAA